MVKIQNFVLKDFRLSREVSIDLHIYQNQSQHRVLSMNCDVNMRLRLPLTSVTQEVQCRGSAENAPVIACDYSVQWCTRSV